MEHGAPPVRVPPAPRPPASIRLVVWLGRGLTGTTASDVFTTISRHRRLSRWWLPFAGSLLLRGRLPRADTELVILRTAYNCSSWYEWVQHAPLAIRSGLSTEAVVAVATGSGAPSWTPRQRLLLEATDELHQAQLISDPTWAGLVSELTPEDCIELCFLVGHYEMVAMTLNSLGVRPEPDSLGHLDAGAAAVASQLCAALEKGRPAST